MEGKGRRADPSAHFEDCKGLSRPERGYGPPLALRWSGDRVKEWRIYMDAAPAFAAIQAIANAAT